MNQDIPLEIEAKYTVLDPATFETLLSLEQLGDCSLRPAAEQRLVDHYLDTADYALHQGGYACRLREKNGQWLVTLKGLGGAAIDAIHQREEYEWPIEAVSLEAAEWPAGPGRDRVLALSAGRPLQELFVIHQQRAVRQLWQDQRQVAELSLDRVALERNGGQNMTHELEIELGPDGALSDLQALGQALQAFAVQPEPRSKFERALALFLPAAPEDEAPRKAARKRKSPGLRGDLPMAEAGRRLLGFHYERMLAHEPGTREGVDIEALHDMRVAIRRQRAAWRIFKPYFKPKLALAYRQALRALGERLGAVRDLDVMLDAARAYQQGLPPEEAAAFQPLLDVWAAEREANRVLLFIHLDGAEHARFEEKYSRFIATEGQGVRPAPESEAPLPHLVRDVAAQAVWEHYAGLRAYEAVLPFAPVPILHTLRIQGKRLRYLLEFLREVLDPCAADAIADLVALQDHIGELHDMDVQTARLQAYLLQSAAAPLPRETVQAVGRYLKQRQARLRQLQRTVGRPWRRVNSVRFRKLLGRAVAAL